ncbi:hypothetical protein [Okeania sp. KiyG1]|uniref:hypothetical protein n=1 Tax=Okeania sp. KiyG1 TaxID=2720165 RepID=UPI0019219EAE|nr:hypothetical protein [Okeania sp. KiyG1]GGA02412.1 hypothetical protein CYANOKiyG1_14470 [Okeania sp. KiyG1]
MDITAELIKHLQDGDRVYTFNPHNRYLRHSTGKPYWGTIKKTPKNTWVIFDSAIGFKKKAKFESYFFTNDDLDRLRAVLLEKTRDAK